MGVTTPEQLPLERLADGLHAFTGKQIADAILARIKSDWELTQ
jgi:hypothetical protein